MWWWPWSSRKRTSVHGCADSAGQADQDGRSSGAALPSIDLSVVRGVGSSKVVRGALIQCFDDALRRFGVVDSSGYQVTARSPVAPVNDCRVNRYLGSVLNWFNHDFAKRESAPGSRLVFNALSPHWRGPEDDKDGQEALIVGTDPTPPNP